MSYEVNEAGDVESLIAPPAADVLSAGVPASRDRELDALLDRALKQSRNHDIAERRAALETIWDAFERIKTVLSQNKQRGSDSLADAVARDTAEAELLKQEMRTLTAIGNRLRIRHHEVDKSEVGPELSEYLFVRMFTLIQRLHPAVAD